MILFYRVSTVLVAWAIMWTTTDATTKESMVLKVYDQDLQLSDSEMLAKLKQADLESHGYKKEETTKVISEPGSKEKVHETSYNYYKIVDCSELRSIDQELNKLIPGIFNVEVVTKINKEITSKHLDTMKKCKAGLEVHFKKGESCGSESDTQRDKKRRKKRGCSWCPVCWRASAEE